jgi:transcriptional regulator with XRE-family HTH domain
VSDRISERQLSLWEKFEEKEYRDGFVSSHLAENINAQIYSTRELRGWTQQEFADKAGMAQARICVMENSSYDKFSLTTLKRLASALDVALIVRFVPFSELAEYATSMGPERLAVRDFTNDRPSQIAARAPVTTQIDPTPINITDLLVGQIIPVTPPRSPRKVTGRATNLEPEWMMWQGSQLAQNTAAPYGDFTQLSGVWLSGHPHQMTHADNM